MIVLSISTTAEIDFALRPFTEVSLHDELF